MLLTKYSLGIEAILKYFITVTYGKYTSIEDFLIRTRLACLPRSRLHKCLINMSNLTILYLTTKAAGFQMKRTCVRLNEN